MEVWTQDSPPPAELRIAWQCERYHCLPEIGALLDQEYQLLRRMAGLSNVYDAVASWHNHTGKSIHNLSEHTRKILRYLQDNDIVFNNAFG